MEYDLYSVESLDNVIGNEHAIAKLRNFAKIANAGKIGMPIMIYGPTGTGKSVAARLLANESNWNIVELNASDYRDKESIERRLLSAATSRPLMGGKNLILLDEIDELAAGFDRGGSAAISNLISKSRNPIIFIANDMWDQSISFLRGRTEPLEFRRLPPDVVHKILARISERFSIKVNKTVMDMIANRSNGDARSAINDLSVLIGTDDEEMTEVIGLRDRKIDVFRLLDKVFTTNTLTASLRGIMGTDVPNDMLIKWIDENIPKRYSFSEDMYEAFDSLSWASTYGTRAVRSQYYTYWRYMNVMMSSGVALAKKHPPELRFAYSFPKVIKELSASKANRANDRMIAEKLQRVFHSSTSSILRGEMVMLTKIIAKAIAKDKNAEDEIRIQLMGTYLLDDKDVDYMLSKGG